MTFHLMCVHIIFSSVCVAEWPLFGKELLTRLTICHICSLCILTICNNRFLGLDLGSDCFSSWSLYIFYFSRARIGRGTPSNINNKNTSNQSLLFTSARYLYVLASEPCFNHRKSCFLVFSYQNFFLTTNTTRAIVMTITAATDNPTIKPVEDGSSEEKK